MAEAKSWNLKLFYLTSFESFELKDIQMLRKPPTTRRDKEAGQEDEERETTAAMSPMRGNVAYDERCDG